MANPRTPRMVGRRFGKLLVLQKTAQKQGPHRLYRCWIFDGKETGGEEALVRGNNLRDRGYVGGALRRKP